MMMMFITIFYAPPLVQLYKFNCTKEICTKGGVESTTPPGII